jgi:PAS domain S-box-containing protein
MFSSWTRIIVPGLILLLAFASDGKAQSPAQTDLLTTDERAWLAAHPVIYLAPDPAYEPVEFFDEQGVYRGISADYVALLEQRLGFRFQVVNRHKVQAAWDAGQVRVDAMPTCVATLERAKTWTFTAPYLEFPTYIITKKSVSETLMPGQLKGSRIAVVAGYGVQEYLATKYPEMILDPVPDTRTGLQKVSFGLVDAFASDLPVATYWMEREGITNLKVSGEVGYVYQLGIGLPSDRAPLNSILEKGLAQITPEERAAIYRKWVRMAQEAPPLLNRGVFWSLFAGLSVACVGLLLAFAWNRSLAAQVKERTAALQQELQERKQAEQELRASEERFATIFRSSPNPLGIARYSDGQVLDVNDRWLQASGFSKEELVGRYDVQTGLWDHLEVRQQVLEILREHRRLRDLEMTYRTKSGEERIALLSVESLLLSGEDCNLWTIQDLTDRKRMEEALRQSEEMFRSLTESTSAWVFIEQNNYCCYVNSAAERGTGYTREELAVMNIWELAHPDHQQWIQSRVAARKQNLPLPSKYEVRVLSKTSEERWLELTTTPIEYRGAFAVLGTAFDITARKCAEEQLKISEQQLHQLAGYLQTVREDERTAIAREIHDELGQALTAMKMDLVWLNHHLPKAADSLQKRLAVTIELVNSTINTVRKLATQLRPGILDDLGLTAALEWQAQEFQARTGITCEFDNLAEFFDLEPARATAIFRICQEALTNVARHARATKVTISLQQESSNLRLEVSDNGRGVTDNELANPRSLGLLGMRERAFLLGGSFRINRRPSGGTMVTAQIPRLQSKAKGGAS